VVESPTVPFRYAPGLSLAGGDEPPPQRAMFTDGDAMTAITRFERDMASLGYLDRLTSAAAYRVVEHPRVLVLGAGGGSDVLQALLQSAPRIDAVELNPEIVTIMRGSQADFAGHLYDRSDVRIHVAEVRAFVAGSRGRWELIQLSLLDSFAAAAAGLQAAAESPIYTVEALRSYLDHLTRGGVLSITRWVQAPPREVLKLFATALLALEQEGSDSPGRQIMLVRGWNTATLLVRQGAPFTPEDIGSVRRFCDERSFDLDWYDGMPAAEADRFNGLPGISLHDAAMALLGPERQRFIDDYRFNIAPTTDDRPYFHRFLTWAALPELVALQKQGGLALLDAGYVVLLATLAQAALASLVLILLPLAFRQRSEARGDIATWRVAVYFGAIGLAFMFVEIALMQTLMLLLGHPLTAVGVVLSGVLVCAGLGSGVSGMLAAGYPRHMLVWSARVLGALVLLYVLLLPTAVRHGLGLAGVWRLLIAVLMIAPLGFLMGLPFPRGLAVVALRSPRLVPWAWSINGCASVVGALLAGLLAMHLGLSAIMLIAALLYAIAAAVFRKVDAQVP
jgi:hypothetical protein